MMRVELGSFCLITVDRQLHDCKKFKGISILHYASKSKTFDYGCHLHIYGNSLNIIEFNIELIDGEDYADTLLTEYSKSESLMALDHFKQYMEDNNIDLRVVNPYLNKFYREENVTRI